MGFPARLVILAWVSLWNLCDGQDAASRPLTATEIRQAIAQLGDPQYVVREQSCVALDPKNPLYRKQLERFQAK